MAIAPTCFKMTIKDHSHGGQYAARQSERCYLSDHLIIPEGSRCIRSILSFDNLSRRRGKNASSFCQAVKKEDQIRALESYFSKLQDDAEDQQLRVDSSQEAEILPQNNQFESEKGLNSLESYLDKVKGGNIILHWSLHGVVLLTVKIYSSFFTTDMNSENCVMPGTKEMVTRGGNSMANPVSVASGKFSVNSDKRSSQLYNVPKTSQEQHQFDGTSDLYTMYKSWSVGLNLVFSIVKNDNPPIFLFCYNTFFYVCECRNIIASLNIAVFLFEIATPIRNSELELFSIPFLYGAKANQLIVLGEWWRLITPMFLVHMTYLGWFHISFHNNIYYVFFCHFQFSIVLI